MVMNFISSIFLAPETCQMVCQPPAPAYLLDLSSNQIVSAHEIKKPCDKSKKSS